MAVPGGHVAVRDLGLLIGSPAWDSLVTMERGPVSQYAYVVSVPVTVGETLRPSVLAPPAVRCDENGTIPPLAAVKPATENPELRGTAPGWQAAAGDRVPPGLMSSEWDAVTIIALAPWAVAASARPARATPSRNRRARPCLGAILASMPWDLR
jgi:hypothetical protein